MTRISLTARGDLPGSEDAQMLWDIARRHDRDGKEKRLSAPMNPGRLVFQKSPRFCLAQLQKQDPAAFEALRFLASKSIDYALDRKWKVHCVVTAGADQGRAGEADSETLSCGDLPCLLSGQSQNTAMNRRHLSDGDDTCRNGTRPGTRTCYSKTWVGKAIGRGMV